MANTMAPFMVGNISLKTILQSSGSKAFLQTQADNMRQGSFKSLIPSYDPPK